MTAVSKPRDIVKQTLDILTISYCSSNDRDVRTESERKFLSSHSSLPAFQTLLYAGQRLLSFIYQLEQIEELKVQLY